jgi:hypothetical protein
LSDEALKQGLRGVERRQARDGIRKPLAARLQFQRGGMVRDRYETLAICRSLEAARAAFTAAIAEKPAGRFMIRSRRAR